MRIVLNGRFLTQDVTGVQRVAREVLGELDKLATERAIETPRLLVSSETLKNMPVLQTIEPEVIGKRRGHLWEQLDLPKQIDNDVLLCLGNTAPVASLRSKKTPVVTMVHDLSYRYFPDAYSWSFKALYERLIPYVLRRSAFVATVSHSEKAAIETHYPFLKDSPRLVPVQNGGLPDDVAQELQAESLPGFDERPYGLYVGSLSKRKNAVGIIKSAIEFLRKYPQRRFVVIGASSSVFEGIDIDVPADVQDRLEMRGQINDPDQVYAAYRNAQFLVFPSFYEASPLPPIEAMTLGCPVISSRIPSLKERCGDAAVYCDADDIDTIVAAMSNLTEDAGFWQDRSQAAREHARTYSWRRQTQELISLCERAL